MYGFLTGDQELTPNNKATIALERQIGNEDGSLMKVIIGSQIAAEGLDLRYVREVHMLDSWYHLNRTEQVIGRAIRFCSHSALPKEKRNATIYLYAATFPAERNRETGDLFSYRQAFRKAVEVGNVTRALKIRAIDCNLNHDAIIIANQDTVEQTDSKGVVREDVDINDKPFTAICDWNDSCMYECAPSIKINAATADDSTYSEFAAAWRESALKQQFRELFKDQVFYDSATLWDQLFGDVPLAARSELFANVINNKAFQVTHNGVQGYIAYCNGYYVFQPNVYTDLHIPMAIRAASFPVRRDRFDPVKPVRLEEESREASASAYSAKFGLVDTWNGIVDWVDELRDAEEEPSKKLPEMLTDRIQQMANDEPELLSKYRYVIQTIQWFYESVVTTNGSRKKFHKTVLEYLWDNWFSMEEQMQLVQEEAQAAHKMVKEAELEFDRSTVLRFYNTADASIQYRCDGKPCSASIVKEVKREEKGIANTFLQQKNDAYQIGQFYGFLSSHMGSIAFKINNAFIPGTKKKLGGIMCSLVSSISDKHTRLLDLGSILEKAGEPNLDLRSDVITKGERKIENSVRGCTLLELVLRYMDHASVDEKRWFFRPVAARLIGYPGYFKKKNAETKEEVPKKSVAKKSVKKEESSDEESGTPVKTAKSAKTVKSAKTAVSSDEEEEEEVVPVKSSKTLRRSRTRV
jgi:hypothetical protein